MEEVGPMKRSQIFSTAVPRPLLVNDSRFGLRKLVDNPEKSRIATYSHPGKGPNGEHQT